MDQTAQSVCDYLDEHQDELIEFLADLIHEPSTPGNEQYVQEVLIEKLQNYGFNPDVWETNIVALRDHPKFLG